MISISLVVFVFGLLTNVQSWKEEQRILETIFKDYDARVPPTTAPNEPVEIEINLYLLRILNIDRSQHTADVSLWIVKKWTDPRLTWNKAKYNNVQRLYVKSSLIWNPDISLQTGEGAFELMSGSNDDIKLEIDSDGTVYYYFPVTTTLPCIHKSDHRDEYACSFILVSWTTSTDELTLKAASKDIDLSILADYFVDPHYEIESATMKVKQQAYSDAPDTKYDVLRARVVLKKGNSEESN